LKKIQAGNEMQFYQSNENIINKPNTVLHSKELQKLFGNNLKLKYLMRYEVRVAEQKLKVKNKKKKNK